MKKIILLLSLFFVILQGYGEERDLIFKVDIKEDIAPPVWRLVKRSFNQAEEMEAKAILIQMNTYGGMVVYADSLRTLILNCRIPVWVFIDNNAASAGALIAIACDRIYMRHGANIGAATVVNNMGEAMPDKYQSYMRSMIRSTAEAHGKDTIIDGNDTIVRWRRDPAIAEAMVDETLEVEGVSERGKIVTFTPREAMRYGFCDGIAGSIDEVIVKEGIENYEIVEYQATALDRIIGFLITPIVQGILIMIIVGGIYFELQTPGVGFPLIAAVTACSLYFAPLYIEGIANHIEIILFVLGIILLLLEIFVLPGFGVAGISGIVCVIVSLALAGVDAISFEFMEGLARNILSSFFFVTICALMALVISIWITRKLSMTRKLSFALHASESVADGFISVDMTAKEELGKEGVAFTDLRPAGKIMVDNEIYDAIADIGFISQGARVKIVKYQSGQLYVERL